MTLARGSGCCACCATAAAPPHDAGQGGTASNRSLCAGVASACTQAELGTVLPMCHSSAAASSSSSEGWALLPDVKEGSGVVK